LDGVCYFSADLRFGHTNALLDPLATEIVGCSDQLIVEATPGVNPALGVGYKPGRIPGLDKFINLLSESTSLQGGIPLFLERDNTFYLVGREKPPLSLVDTDVEHSDVPEAVLVGFNPCHY
jgi:hypothetical protein